MKYILLPIHSNWVCSIMNDIKKIEVRSGTRLYNAINRLIDEQGKAPCLIYCTKGKPYLLRSGNRFALLRENLRYTCIDKETAMNGKVVAMFEASAEIIKRNQFSIRYTETLCADELSEHSCLNQTEMSNYLGIEEGTAIHIHNLKIFGLSKELKDFFMRDKKGDIPVQVEELKGSKFMALKRIEHAPQSYCFCEVEE